MISIELRQLLHYVKKYKASLVGNFIFNILFIFFSLFSIATVAPFLKLIFDTTANNNNLNAVSFDIQHIKEFILYKSTVVLNSFSSKQEALSFLCILIVIVFLIKNIFRYTAIYFMSHIRNGIVRDIQNELYAKILDLPLRFFTKERKGDIMMRMTSDVKEVEYGILGVLEIICKDPLFIILYLITLCIINIKLTLFVLLMVGIMAFIISRIGKTLKRQSIITQEKLSTIVSMIDETISGIRVISAFNNGAFLKEKFNTENESFFKLMRRNIRRRDLSSPLSEFLIISVLSAVLWFGGYLVFKNEISSTLLISYLLVFASVVEPFKRISNASYNIQKGLISFKRIREILVADNPIKNSANAISNIDFKTSVNFNDVHFSYNIKDGKEIIKGISFTMKKGTVTALVGLSGSGKSTIADLLCRFYDVNTGSICIDDINIKNIDIHTVKSLISIVSQEPILFNDSVRNNITFGKKNCKEEDIIQACKIANAHEFIMKLEKGYDTFIGDRGMTLSGGERQRLTIARAVLRNTPILILDEATSSLDSESERLVQDALQRLMKDKTSLVIAHRLSTVQHVDSIIVMQEGKIVEAGKHNELIEKNGVYSKLVALQMM